MTSVSDSAARSTVSSKNAGHTPRLFWVGMAAYMTVIVIVGFWPSYFTPLIAGERLVGLGVVDASGILHVHAAVYFGWMVLLVTQAALVSRGQTQTHMTFGRYGMIFGLLVIAIGLVMTFVKMQSYVSNDMATWAEAPLEVWTSIETITQFIVLLVLGYVYRFRPEAHKRYMLFATGALLFAATDRMFYLLGPWCAEIMFPLTVGPIFAVDLYTQGRIHPATLIGTAILLPHFALRILL